MDTTAVTVAPEPRARTAMRWSPLTRIGFRFGVAYFGLYVLVTQMLPGLLLLPVGGIPAVDETAPATNALAWLARHVFRVSRAFLTRSTGSGDKLLNWVEVAVLLAVAAVATTAWSVADRRREAYPGVQKWFWLFLRFAVGSTMFGYGFAKVVPLQMPFPSLVRLLERYGDFSPMGVLWYSVGASRPYEIVVGSAEVLAGTLLMIPRTWVAGALVTLADASMIFTLNMTFDVPVKLFSFHLILMALFLLAPEMRRLVNVILLQRAAPASSFPPLFATRGARRIAGALQIAFMAYLFGLSAYGSAQAWTTFGGGAPKPPLYGIWNVDVMRIDGHTRSPLLTDYDRWRRVIVWNKAGLAVQRMDDSFAIYGATVDEAHGTIAVTVPTTKAKAQWTFVQPDAAHLTLAGAIDGHAIEARLTRFDEKTLLLMTRGFHWIQEAPFNR